MLPILCFILFISSVVLLFVNQKYKRKYIKVYKDEIISNFIKGLYPNLTYKTTEAYETLGIEARKSYEKAILMEELLIDSLQMIIYKEIRRMMLNFKCVILMYNKLLDRESIQM